MVCCAFRCKSWQLPGFSYARIASIPCISAEDGRLSSPLNPASVGGLYEACVGVPDLVEAIAFFEAFGCRVGRIATMPAARAERLYGVKSALRSVRLAHQQADHGLVRLMQWEQPRNTGLGLAENLRCVGSRWGVRVTASAFGVMNHAERAREAGMPVVLLPPQLAVIGEVSGQHVGLPLRDPIVGVREMVLITPWTRQVIFERFGYSSPLYGQVDPNSLLQTSQHTHFGLMIASDDAQLLDFYEQVLGLRRMFDEHTPYEDTRASRQIFGLEPGEGFHMVDFDDPHSGHSLAERRSGKLKCVRFAAGARMADLRDRSRAGSLGYSLYSWRVRDIEAMWKRVTAAGASAVTDVCEDEFGVRAFSFNAPDGYHCLLLQA